MRRPTMAALLSLLLVLAACDAGGGGGDTGGTAQATAGEAGGGSGRTGEGLTISVITHGEGGSFWAVHRRGAQAAADDLGVQLDYQEADNDPQVQAQLIDTAVTQGVDGIAVSVPDAGALRAPLAAASDAGIPIVTLNSGAEDFRDLGAFTHVGQTETIAGEGGGERLSEEADGKLLCVIHEQGNDALQQRCSGAASTYDGEVENFQVSGTADISTSLGEIQTKLETDDSIGAVLTLNPDIAMAARDAIAGAGVDVVLGTFDLSGDVVSAIEAGEISFAIDQQQYLQGYLPVLFLVLYNTNANTVGGGLPVLTGPGFVDQSNAADVADLAEAGTR
jgi:simple sugar transport system substrate-binding protein